MRDDPIFEDRESAPTVEVKVYRHGRLIHRELCESEADAASVLERWNEVDGAEFQVDDLAVHHVPSDILEPTEAVLHDP